MGGPPIDQRCGIEPPSIAGRSTALPGSTGPVEGKRGAGERSPAIPPL